jgi:hypothetical protein
MRQELLNDFGFVEPRGYLLDEDVSVGQRVRPKGTLVEVGPEELAEVVRRQALRELGLFALRQALQSVKVFPDIIPIYLGGPLLDDVRESFGERLPLDVGFGLVNSLRRVFSLT